MALADVYRKRFLASKGFAGGSASSTFSPMDAFNMQLSDAGFYTGSNPEMPEDLDIQPETMNQYFGMKEISKQQSSGRRVATSPLKWKLGRRFNRYQKYL